MRIDQRPKAKGQSRKAAHGLGTYRDRGIHLMADDCRLIALPFPSPEVQP